MSPTPRKALIIGAGGPIGSALTRRLASDGFAVAAVGRSAAPLEALRAELGARVVPVTFDVTTQFGAESGFASVRQALGDIDAVVYAAGLPPDPDVPLADYPLASWNATLSVYLTGFFLCFQQALRTLRPGGHLVALSSAVTRFPDDGLPPLSIGHYAAARAGMNELIRWARRESRARGILLSRIAPAAVDTPVHRDAPPARRPKALVALKTVVDSIAEAIDGVREVDLLLLPAPPSQG